MYVIPLFVPGSSSSIFFSLGSTVMPVFAQLAKDICYMPVRGRKQRAERATKPLLLTLTYRDVHVQAYTPDGCYGRGCY